MNNEAQLECAIIELFGVPEHPHVFGKVLEPHMKNIFTKCSNTLLSKPILEELRVANQEQLSA